MGDNAQERRHLADLERVQSSSAATEGLRAFGSPTMSVDCEARPRAEGRRGSTRIAYVTASATTQWAFLRGQNQYLRERGYELHCIASPGPLLKRVGHRDGASTWAVPIDRRIRPLADSLSLLRLVCALRRIRPDILHVSTSKGAFLGAVAGSLVGVPIRVFLVRGLASETASGPRGWIYRQLERITVALCHETVCVSPSLLRYAQRAGILRGTSGVLIANGMSNGIDLDRFAGSRQPGSVLQPRGNGPRYPVIGFVGRVATDKGIGEFHAVWLRLRKEFTHLGALVVGPLEPGDPEAARHYNALGRDPRVCITGLVDDTAPWYRAMDVLVFPTHGTEGFPNAPMEAAAAGLPVVATRTIGCVDAIVDGATGTLVGVGDTEGLKRAVTAYLLDPELRRAHGAAARARVERDFGQEPIWHGTWQTYERLLELRRGRAWPGAWSDAQRRERITAPGSSPGRASDVR